MLAIKRADISGLGHDQVFLSEQAAAGADAQFGVRHHRAYFLKFVASGVHGE